MKLFRVMGLNKQSSGGGFMTMQLIWGLVMTIAEDDNFSLNRVLKN